jgi:hypothetical protein
MGATLSSLETPSSLETFARFGPTCRVERSLCFVSGLAPFGLPVQLGKRDPKNSYPEFFKGAYRH